MRMNLAAGLLASLVLTIPAYAAAPAAGPALTAAEVKAQIVGHRVMHGDPGDSMTFSYERNGTYFADDGRNGRQGKYTVRADGHVCWTETTGVAGCFQYYRSGKDLRLRRTDPGHLFDLGPAKIEPL